MSIHKARGADVRRDYGLFVESGLAAAIGLCVLAVRAPIRPAKDAGFDIRLVEQERIEMEEISQTAQKQLPPPPPRPAIPIEVPNEVILPEEELNFDASLNLSEAATALPTPPAPAVREVEEEEEEETELFVIVEEMPQLIGGLEALQRELKYPEVALRAGLEGRVFVEFIVDVDGSVTAAHVLRGIGGGCDEEALRAISLAHFVPGKQRGRPVRVKMSIPVVFRLRHG